MSLPFSSTPRNLVTPIEPASARLARASVALPPSARETSYSIAFGRIDVAVASSCGSLHHRNEDAHSPPGHPTLLFVVADGVGGGAMAETASRELVAHLHSALDEARPDAAGVRRAMLGADRAIASRIARVTTSPGAATVVMCAPVNVLASKWLIAWVGDCRAYRLSGRGELRFELLTRDDTFRQLNEEPPEGGSPDDPARMVGNGATTGANVVMRGLGSGEVLALCSDGLHKHVTPSEWRRVLTQPVPLARRCDDLIALASANGSTDDATVLLVQRIGFASARPHWLPPFPGDDAASGEQTMTPAAIDRVFGRGRLRMVTGDHVEVFREESQPGERRRYTKRFLATPAGDFREWTEREWRILARLVGHGIGPVPDVVQFDRGTGGRQALVQTYDAGVTIDHWTTLLPVQRDGETRSHVFEDCAHWWALARHSLIALDAIHDLHLVHLDLKADNVCIPVGPVDFDPDAPGATLFPDFERITLIDFAFSLVSGERLDSALPIARQTEFDYQSPRLLAALDEGSRGNLWPTRLLDWRCDLFSLAAMLRRYLPEPDRLDACGWTAARRAQARALVRRLLEAHDGDLPAVRPHADLIALTDDELRDPELADSLRRGWLLGERSLDANDDSPTPITRIALPLALPLSPLRFVDTGEVIAIDPSDVEGWAAANPPPPKVRPRRRVWIAGLVGLAAAAAAVPLLGETWLYFAGPVAAPRVVAPPPRVADAPPQRVASARVEPKTGTTASLREPGGDKAPAKTVATPTESSARIEPPAVVSAASAPGVGASVPTTTGLPAADAERRVVRVGESAPVADVSPSPAAVAASAVEPMAKTPEPAVARAPEPVAKPTEPTSRRAPSSASRRAAAPKAATPPTRSATVAPLRTGEPVTVRPAAFPQSAKATVRSTARSSIYLPPAVGLAPLPGRNLETATAPLAVAAAAASPAATPAPAPPLADDAAVAAPPDFMLRANELLSTQIPRIAQRAERMVLRVLVAAGRADEDGSDDAEIRLAASGIRLAPDDPQLTRTAVRESRQFHEGARIALRRGDFAEAVGQQTRAFGANPVDAEIVGSLAYLRLRQSPSQAEAARRLALHALTLHDWKYPAGRIEDWNTFAIASALTGRERDARNAWLVALALAGGSERQCRAALDAYALYGEALRSPVEAMLYRANAATRAPRSRLCEWPPHWSASTR